MSKIWTIGQRCLGRRSSDRQDTRARAARASSTSIPATRGIGVNEQGAFAEYLRLPAFNVVPLPDEIDDEIGAILDPLGNAVHTALSFDLVGEDVLITGAGPIGIMAAAVARHVGARHVVITDVNHDRLALAARVADVVPVNVDTAGSGRNQSSRAEDETGLRRRAGNVRQSARAGPDGRGAGDGRAHRAAGHPAGQIPGRLVPHRVQGDHHQGRLRPRDFRDLVQDDRDAAKTGSTCARSSPTVSRSTISQRASTPCAAAPAARSCSTGPSAASDWSPCHRASSR